MRMIFPLIFTFIIIGAFHYTHLVALKFYPALINLLIFFVFFSSLFAKETIIQKFAKIMEGKDLPDIVKKYTRNLTYIWCVFLIFNFLISFATIFMSSKIWTIYNGCISYILTGTIFAVEYIIRIIFKRKHNV